MLYKAVFLFVLFLITFVKTFNAQTLFINEFMASNASYMADEDGDYEDWVEIYNAGTFAVNLSGYGLSDDSLNSYKWVFPDTVIAPGAFMLIWASGKDRAIPGMPLHTSWRISKSGEELLLTDTTGNIIDFIPPLYLPTDISYGRYPDGGSSFLYYSQPTAGSSNTSSGYPELISSPTFSHAPGFYTDSFYLQISHPDTAITFRYTLDGSLPTPTSPLFPDSLLIYNRKNDPNDLSDIPTTPPNVPEWHRWYPPLDTVFKGTNIRFKAFKDSALSPKIWTKTFWVDDSIYTRYSFPVISISLEQSALFGPTGIYTNYSMRGFAWERDMHIEFFEPDGALGFATDAGVRIHGGHTRRVPNKSLRIYFRNLYGESRIDYPIFPQLEENVHERLLLRAGGSDWARTFLRCALVQAIIEPFSDVETQAYRPAILFINGEYWGMTNIRERYDNQYIEHNYGYEDIDLLARTGQVVYGTNSHYNALISFLNNNSLADSANYAYVKTQMDVEDFRDYHILQVFSMNVDQPGKNVRFWRPQTPYGKWRWLLYDLDDTFIFRDHCNYDRNGLVFCSGLDSISATSVNPASSWPPYAPNGPTQTFPLRALLRGPEFQKDFINRFADLLNTAFSPDYLNILVDSFDYRIKPYMDEHYRCWTRPTPTNNAFHLDNIRLFASNRQQYMRQHILSFFELQDSLLLQLNVSDTTQGHIKVNTIHVADGAPGILNNAYPWEGIYFKDIPIKLKAIPKQGYLFSHWSGVSNADSAFFEKTFYADTVNITAHFMKDTLASIDSLVVHYWHFNDLPSGTLEVVESDTSKTGQAYIKYLGSGDGYMDAVNVGTDINAHFLKHGGQSLRVRNPSGNRELLFGLPTTGYQDIEFKYVVYRTTNGAQLQNVEYQTSPSSPWESIGSTVNVTENFELHAFDFSSIEEANNNPFFRIRILFDGPSSDNTSGNNRFDNISLLGTPYLCKKQLVHYFHFNELPNDTVEEVHSDFSLTTDPAEIVYEGTGDGYMDNVDDGTFINAYQSEDDGQGLRVRNPSVTRELVFSLPTTNVFEPAFSYVVKRTTNGAQQQIVSYREDSISPWIYMGGIIEVTEDYSLQHFCFKDIDAAQNNPDFQVKINFMGPSAANTSGNNRFDNISLHGNVLQVDSVFEMFCSGTEYRFYDEFLNEAGNYTYTIQDVNGCDSAVIALELDVYTITTAQHEIICDSFYVHLGDTLTNSGFYTDTLTSMLGCDSVVVLELELIEIDTTVTLHNGVLTASQTGADQYSWLDCDDNYNEIPGAYSQTFAPTVDGSYAARIYVDTCFALTACHEVIGTAITDKHATKYINIYPTPNKGEFTLELDGLRGEMFDIQIFNVYGQIVYDKTYTALMPFSRRINMKDTPAGTYLLVVNTTKERLIERFIIY